MKSVEYAEILYNNEISSQIFEMCLFAPNVAKEAKAGQFINIYTGLGEYILPRPISINEIDIEKGTVTVVYQVIGKGTEFFSGLASGQEIKILGPLGNGFDIRGGIKEHIVVGGGIGIPPLVELVKKLDGNVSVFLGAKSAPILSKRFEELGADVYISSDDGSAGFKGTVIELIESVKPSGEMIYTCGPKVMLKSISKWAEERKIPIQVSMEERMACGIGACVGCAVKIRKTGESEWQNLKVCKDGPVFMGNEVVWDE